MTGQKVVLTAWSRPLTDDGPSNYA